MPDTRNRSSSSSSGESSDAAEIAAVLDAARSVLRYSNGWTIDPAHLRRLRKDFAAIGLDSSDAGITKALQAAFSEIKTIRRRIDQSYSGLVPDQTLYDQRWTSAYCERVMYIKFAMSEGVFELFTFHENKDERNRR